MQQVQLALQLYGIDFVAVPPPAHEGLGLRGGTEG